MPSLYEQCQSALAVAIRGLNLDGLEPTRVYERIRSYDTAATYPCVEVTFEDMHERCSIFDSENVEWEFPLAVVILTRGDVDDKPSKAKYAGWREEIINRIPGQKIGVPGELRAARVEPEWTFLPKGPEWLRVAGGVVVKITVLASRP